MTLRQTTHLVVDIVQNLTAEIQTHSASHTEVDAARNAVRFRHRSSLIFDGLNHAIVKECLKRGIAQFTDVLQRLAHASC